MDKVYELNGEKFTMPPLTLGEMEGLQALIDDKDILEPTVWISLIRKRISQVLSLILKPKKDENYFRQNVKANDKFVKEVVKDFFQRNSPLTFLLSLAEGLGVPPKGSE